MLNLKTPFLHHLHRLPWGCGKEQCPFRSHCWHTVYSWSFKSDSRLRWKVAARIPIPTEWCGRSCSLTPRNTLADTELRICVDAAQRKESTVALVQTRVNQSEQLVWSAVLEKKSDLCMWDLDVALIIIITPTDWRVDVCWPDQWTCSPSLPCFTKRFIQKRRWSLNSVWNWRKKMSLCSQVQQEQNVSSSKWPAEETAHLLRLLCVADPSSPPAFIGLITRLRHQR